MPALPVYKFNLYRTTHDKPKANSKAPIKLPTLRYTKPAIPMKTPAKIDLFTNSIILNILVWCGAGWTRTTISGFSVRRELTICATAPLLKVLMC